MHGREGGPRNGVRTAIEDFLAQTSFKLTFVSIPGCHGLGILGTEELLSSAPFKAILESWTPAVIRHCRQLEEERLKEQEWLRGQRFLYERLCDRSATSTAEKERNEKELTTTLQSVRAESENVKKRIEKNGTYDQLALDCSPSDARHGACPHHSEEIDTPSEPAATADNAVANVRPDPLRLPERLLTIIPTSGENFPC